MRHFKGGAMSYYNLRVYESLLKVKKDELKE